MTVLDFKMGSDALAEYLGVQHKNLVELIQKLDIQPKFRLAMPKGTGRPKKVYELSTEEAALLVMCSKGNIETKKFLAKNGHEFLFAWLQELGAPKDLGCFYIVGFDDMLKVGVSKNPNKRMRDIETQSGRMAKTKMFIAESEDFRALESGVLDCLDAFRLEGEYLKCSVADVFRALMRVRKVDLLDLVDDLCSMGFDDCANANTNILYGWGFTDKEVKSVLDVYVEDLGVWS